MLLTSDGRAGRPVVSANGKRQLPYFVVYFLFLEIFVIIKKHEYADFNIDIILSSAVFLELSYVVLVHVQVC